MKNYPLLDRCVLILLVGVQIQKCVGTSLPQIRKISCPCPRCFATNQTPAMFGLAIRRARAPRISASPNLGPASISPLYGPFPLPAPAPLRKIHKGRRKYTTQLPPCQPPCNFVKAEFKIESPYPCF